MSCEGTGITKLCSIDFSSKKTGIAYFINGKYNCHCLIDCSKHKDMEIRFYNMCLGIWEVLEIVKPDIIYIEETVVLRNAQTQRFLTRMQGVIYAWCMNNGCEFNTIRPTQWRAAIGISQGRNVKREQLKAQAIQYVKRKYDLDVNDDEADAICIGDAVISIFLDKKAKVTD